MISHPNLIFYACIAKETTILAEFNSKDADLATLAVQCLEKTPNLHTIFSHTVRNRTYTFFIEDPFVYFAIYDEKLENSEAISFLRSVKNAFDKIYVKSHSYPNSNLNSHCFQGEFNPVFHQLLASPVDFESPQSPRQVLKILRSGSLDSPRGKRIGSMPLLGSDSPRSLKKKKRFSSGESRDGLVENNMVDSDRAIVLNRELTMSMHKHGFYENSSNQKAKRVWKRHVWVVLVLDLIMCLILFGVWLWICRGFKCIDG